MAIDFKTELSNSVLPPTDVGGITLFVDSQSKKLAFKNASGSLKYFADVQFGKRTTITSSNVNFKEATIQALDLTSTAELSISNQEANKTIMLEVSTSNSSQLTFPSGSVVITGSFDSTGAKNYIYVQCIEEVTPIYLFKILQGS